ncbi:hypothetical protein FSP39_008004 [Pinctada imbricata]|uniref:Uncharacterized protein n=1 Tax=Pinctada imbricata TaxID=66713 RepID=A0AA89C6V0_PINIB|nr:hypothetical protein FSP39_008004 [Pinctada imbricata]
MNRREMTTFPSPRSIFERYRRQGKQENILLIGSVGAGKSATINTISAALSGEKLYHKCGIDANRQKDLHVPPTFPNLVDMTGLPDDNMKFQEQLLEMILMGRIPDKTSIPALLDLMKNGGGSKIRRMFPFVLDRRRIHKILFVASASEPIPRALIECVKNVAQPDGSSSNLNPRYIPIFGILTKTDLVDWKDSVVQKREAEFLECLGIDSSAAYSQWKNSPSGEFTSGTIYFLDKLLSPGVKPVMDQVFCLNRLAGEVWENPAGLLMFFLCIGLPISVLSYWLLPILWNNFLDSDFQPPDSVANAQSSNLNRDL